MQKIGPIPLNNKSLVKAIAERIAPKAAGDDERWMWQVTSSAIAGEPVGQIIFRDKSDFDAFCEEPEGFGVLVQYDDCD